MLELDRSTLGFEYTTRENGNVVSENICLVKEMRGKQKGAVATLSK